MAPTPFEILAFDLAQRRCGLPLAAVREVVRAVAIDQLPGAPRWLGGAVNLRGLAVAVFDLRARLELPAKPVELSDHLIFALAADRTIAMRVDRATAVQRLEPGEIEIAEDVAPGAGYVKGADEILLIHDLRLLVGDEVFGALDALGDSATAEAR